MANIKNGKPGSKSVGTGAGSNPAGNSGGNPGCSMPQKPIPGPTSTGGPISLKRALTRKDVRGSDATGAAGLIR